MSQKPQLEIAHSELVNDFLLIKWTDETESIISFQTLRDNCPCASCAGETDALGNVYKGPEKLKSDSKLALNLGGNARDDVIRFTWSERTKRVLHDWPNC